MAKAISKPIASLIGNSALLHTINPGDYVDEKFGLPTITDILHELDKPGRDPRPEFKTATFKDGVETLKDLEPGMVLEGTITNVTNFGTFVDIGVHQDGLVHISALTNRYVKDPREVVKAGDIVQVKVMEIDIGLSMRMDDEPGRKNSRKEHPEKVSHKRKQAPPKRNQEYKKTGTMGELFSKALKKH